MEISREELRKLDKEEIIDILLAIMAKVAELTIIVNQQAERIAELEARLNQNSGNSSKPPSKDGYNKPPTMRKPSGKERGGQRGHKGSGLKLPQPPSQFVNHNPSRCSNCNNAATCEANRLVTETRYEIDIEIKPTVTAHQAMRVTCPRTGHILTGNFPMEITSTMQYGVNLEALAISLNVQGAVSVGRTHEILSGVFGVPISTGTISNMVSDCADSVRPTIKEIKAALVAEPLVGFDETGTAIDGKTHWAHVASTETLTHIEVKPKRGREAMDAIGILPNFRHIGVHDCLASYFKYTAMLHALCNAHTLRELEGITQNYKQDWADKLAALLRTMKQAKDELMANGETAAPDEMIAKFNRAYDAILIEAAAINPIPPKDPSKKGRIKKGKARSLIERLITHKAKYLRFFSDFTVPFDNNQAERDIRMFKVKQKVSGCFRSTDGANDFAAILSFISTARKRGFSAFISIRDALLGYPFSLAPVHL